MPRYDLSIELNPAGRRVSVQQVVTWTNCDHTPTDQLVFQVVPNHRLSDKMIKVGERTVESLRLDPGVCIDRQGRRFHLNSVDADGQQISWQFDSRHDTHLVLQLPKPVQPGECITVRLNYRIDIPPVMGRLGQHKGVTNLLNWYPVLAVYREGSWRPVPYIPWHQPWYNEAGIYDARLTLPSDHKVVTGGHVVSSQDLADGRRTLTIHGEGLRDFTIVASARFHELQGQAGAIPIRVLYFPEHRHHAEVALRTAEDAIRTYSDWFGPYPYREFELTESYFGWNGNESSGVVMVDERIFDTPAYASRYVEHLVSHEICHQWWYSAVGTNGYDEPWMDEGLVTWLTRVKMEDKYGSNPEMLDFSGYGPIQFPNVQYRSLVHSGYDLYQSRGGSGTSSGSLDDMGHLHNLFFLVYDRGARIMGMIQHRLGRDQFFAFLKYLYGRYRFRQLSISEFHSELEAFTGQDWDEFFDQWLYDNKSADWSLEKVTVTETEGGYKTQARVKQLGAVKEPVDVEFSFEQNPFRLATLSEAQQQDGVQVEQVSPNDWLVTIVSEEKPSQVMVDPNGMVLDENVQNNSWHTDCSVRVSPFYTPVDEASLMQPWGQHGCVAGFGVDSEGRIGLRGSLVASNRYRISPFVAYTAATASRNDDHVSAGIDAIAYNLPSANWQLLARYEHALLSTLENDPGHQARFAVRRIINYTTSLIYPNLSYIDFYTRLGDNFFPDQDTTVSADPRIQSYGNVRAFGIDYHADSQMPYWDPDRGVRLDANFEHGFHVFGDGATYDRLSAQLGVVQRLTRVPGWLSDTKLAGRVSGGYGWDDNGEHFRFGGPGRFRGRAASQDRSNAFWLTSVEWRFPLTGELDYEVLDNTAALNSIAGAVFYDVGESFLLDQSQGVDHAIGGGLYFRIPLLSFVENVTVRTEYGYSLVNNTSAVWFGLYRAF
ncbi:MAG: BamA/TamA family outer membrane protein [Planctomycetaceae bacterium]|nr:BamA/TamA family outer membrane protein [Planctomycetaceae bacterium]